MSAPSSRIERERAFHDDRYTDEVRSGAQKYYSITRASTRLFDQRVDRLDAGQRVLELGCGVHATAWGLARRGVEVTAIDISPVAVDEFNRRVADEGLSATLEARVMNAEALEFAPASFDAVVGTGILHHLDLARVFGELTRVLRPDGFGVFVEPLGHNPLVNAYRRLTPKMRTPDEHPLRTADFTLAERWFERVDVAYFHLATLGAVPFRRWSRFPAVLDRLERFDDRLFARVPQLRPWAWTAVVELTHPRSG